MASVDGRGTFVPGKKKYNSIRKRDMYEALKREGMSKRKAAMISNAWMRDDGRADGKRAYGRGRKARRR